MLGRDLAHLEVGARRDVDVTAPVRVGEVGHPRELPVVQDAVGDAQAAHVMGLVRGEPEHAVVAPAEVVLGLGGRARGGLRDQAVVALERVLGALPLLLLGELAAGLDRGVLRLDVDRVRARGLGRRGAVAAHQAAGEAGGTDPRGEALEVALLLGVEVLGHVCLLHAARGRGSAGRPNIRSSMWSQTGSPVRIRLLHQPCSPMSPTKTAPIRRPSSTRSLR
ncbi:hypothetical protein MPOCJGCO_4896 [Methylobacterium trifolii]|uniref:Uncharacterized protein n=1 Tax=Methylobacterium trifolii TaxID=1003092 RepID=A0ABQ4U9A7_9HYPH|nr:hypothetical protein MPOCJGCO_4896 [Methylobacterium trifolii]